MSDAKPSIDELTDKAEMLEEQGDLPEALEAWGDALRYHTTPYLLYRFGSLALASGMWSEAEKSLLQAVRIAPDFSAAYLRLGILNMDRGRYESAELFLQRGLEIEETAAMYTLLGVAQRHLARRSAAMESLRKAVKIDPAYEEGYYNLGVMLSSDGPREAREMLELSLKLDPEYQSAHRELGWVLRQLELYDEAECHIRLAIALDKSDGWAYIYLGNLQWARNQLDAAEQSFKMAVHVWPEESISYWSLAMFYQYNDRTEEARFFYDAAVRFDCDDPQVNFRFGMFLKELGEKDRAKAHLERVLQSEPENEEARVALAELG